jgi:cytochrome b561
MKNLLVLRFHPLLVTLHWLVAALIIALLCIGFFLATAMSNSDPQKPTLLMWHMAGGMFVAVLMTLRLAVRLLTSRPADATTGYPRLDRIAKLTHYGFYVLVFLMAGTGLATAILAGNLSNLCGTFFPGVPADRFPDGARSRSTVPPLRAQRRIAAADVVWETHLGSWWSGLILTRSVRFASRTDGMR